MHQDAFVIQPPAWTGRYDRLVAAPLAFVLLGLVLRPKKRGGRRISARQDQ